MLGVCVLRSSLFPIVQLQQGQNEAWGCVPLHSVESTKVKTRFLVQADKTSIESKSLHLSADTSKAIIQQQELLFRCKAGHLAQALDLLNHIETALPDYVYIPLLKLCNKTKDVLCAKRVYDHVVGHCVECTRLLLEHLIVTLATCGDIEDALQLFENLSFRTVVSWTALITSWIDCGQPRKALEFYDSMEKDAVEPNHYTFVSLFKACGSIPNVKRGKEVHALAVKRGLSTDVFVANTIISMYGKFGAVEEAENLFCSLSYHDLVSWNAMLSAYAEQHCAEEALMLFRQMQKEGLNPNGRTFSIAIQACSTLGGNEEILLEMGVSKQAIQELGHALHADAQRNTLDSGVVVGTALLCMYSKCGKVQETENAFRSISQHDAVSWTAMQSAYIGQGDESKALQLFVQMQQEGVSPNQQSYLMALQACASSVEKGGYNICEGHSEMAFLAIGKALYECAVRKGHASSLSAIGNAYINLLGKCGAIVEAETIFCALGKRDIVSWNTMLSAYVEQGEGKKALQLFKHLLKENNIKPDELSFVPALKACGVLAEQSILLNGQPPKAASLEIGVAIHRLVSLQMFDLYPLVGNTLIRMYGKCDLIAKAEEVFWGLIKRDIVSWNAFLTANVEQGHGEKVLHFYKKMQQEGACLTEVTLMCILQACGDLGSLETCCRTHFMIVSAGWDLELPLMASLIHAYGGCGSMVDAQAVLNGLPEPVAVSWNACLHGYAGVGNSIACANLFNEMKHIGLQPDGVTFASVLSSCSNAGFIQSGLQSFDSMMTEYGRTPDLIHFSNMVNLFGRTGNFDRVMNLLETMTMPLDLTLLSNLLLVCGIHGNVELGQELFKHSVNLQPKDSTAFVFMSNICAETGLPQPLVTPE